MNPTTATTTTTALVEDDGDHLTASLMWDMGFQLGLVVLCYIILVVWVSFGPAECPRQI